MKRMGTVTKALVQPADGSAAKTLPIKELGGGIGKKIIPAVLSSHLNPEARTLKQGLAAKDIRGAGTLAGQELHVVVVKSSGPTLVLKTAAVIVQPRVTFAYQAYRSSPLLHP